jgi:hypothetical protein
LKRSLSILGFLLAALVVAAQAFAAGSAISCTAARSGTVYTVTCVYTSDDTTGACTKATSLLDGVFLSRVAFNPGLAGVQPSDAYDLTITDAWGVDVIGGGGANLSQTTKTNAQPKVGATPAVVAEYPVKGALTANLTNMGNSKQTTIIFIGRKP